MALPELNSVLAQKVEVAPSLNIIRVIPEGWEFLEKADFREHTKLEPGSIHMEKYW
jgi:hypothetical protein